MKKKIFLSILGLLFVAGGYFGYKLFKPAVSNKKDSYFYIYSGDDVVTVKEHLVSGGFINGNDFNLVSKLLKYKSARPGRYKLTDGVSLYKLVKLLRSGNQALVKLVINKERTKELFAGKIGKGKKFDVECDSLQMIHFLSNNDSLKRFGVDSNTVMSIVMPYTYELKWNSTPGKILQQFNIAYEKFWTAERKIKADTLHLTPLHRL